MPTFSRRKVLTLFILFSLVLIAVGPNLLPRILGNVIKGAGEGIPCDWLRNPPDLRKRQSLLARFSTEPLSVRVKSEPFPIHAESNWRVKIIVYNRTAGTIPILYHPDQVLIGDDPNTSGFGVTFRPVLPLQNFASRQARTSYNLEEIRLLGPRQRCYIALDFPGAASIIDTETIRFVTAQAYYRILSRGEHPMSDEETDQAVFPDQGLLATIKSVGMIFSPELEISLPSGS